MILSILTVSLYIGVTDSWTDVAWMLGSEHGLKLFFIIPKMPAQLTHTTHVSIEKSLK